MKILDFPLTKITFCFIAGILSCKWVSISPSIVIGCLLFLFFGLLFSYFFVLKIKPQNYYFGVISLVLSFLIGISTFVFHQEKQNKSNFINQIKDFENPQKIELTLREKLKSSSFSQRYVGSIKKLNSKESTGKILLNIYKDSLDFDFQIGQQLQFVAIIYKPKKPNNPDQFDYSKYLENKLIFGQVYTVTENIKVNTVVEKDIWFYADWVRTRIKKSLEKNKFSKTELAVTMALLLGQQQDINPEIVQDYQLSGAVHILSVSGLHIGFLMLFISFLLKPMPKTRFYSFLKLGLILVVLWFFAFIAGLSPSVVRSVTMFSFVAIGMHLKRKTNIYHTLLVSMLLILLFQPSFLFDVGFQLSYVALFFILWLQPLLKSLWFPKTKIVNYFWDILTVSFAAQIGAFPLSIYYFHQFPGLFFVTNLIVIPIVTVIMIWGVVVLALAAFDCVPVFCTKILEYLIFLMNLIIKTVASLEQFIIQDISFNQNMLFSSYLAIIALIIWFKKSSFNKLVFVFLGILSFQISYFSAIWENQNKKELIVFNSKKATLIGEQNGSNLSVFSNDSLSKNKELKKLLKPYLVTNFSKISQEKRLQNLLYFNANKILILDSTAVYLNLNPDILILVQSPKINLDRVFETLKPKLVIVDASNYKSYSKLWEVSCNKAKIPFHNTVEKGFYRLE